MKNNKFAVVAAMAASIWLLAGGASLQAMERPKAAPVDFRACNLKEGKTWKDLDKATAAFREYTNQNDFDYAAWTLIPEFQSQSDFDFGWLGAWSDSESFGVSTEHWKTHGRAVYAEMAKTMDCTLNHQLALSLPINAPESQPEDGVLMFYACDLEDNKTFDDAYRAHLDLGQVMKAKGSLGVSWLFQPALGEGTVDYYHVVGFYRYSDMGATMEMYANGGGQQEFAKHLGGVSSCGRPAVYDAVSVRARDER